MSKRYQQIQDICVPESYRIEQQEYVAELDSFALLLRHKKSGARVLLFANDDENKVFSIGFRTPPDNSTGIPHIIEHTVLCGSEEFPAKDPFVELVKGSLNTYLNATTYPDKTLYPVASCNDKDFQNLMHVYMDAVFHPNIYKYPEIFKQEGWHYEMTDPEGDITYNGVVYNEMKGAYSSAEAVLERYLMKGLFPDNTYGKDSGGDPACIPDLTREEYLDFHRRYYHPVNSYIYLYGNMDMTERLEWMDAHYLSDYEKISLDSEIDLQNDPGEMQRIRGTYAVTQGADEESSTYYGWAVAMDVTLDQEICAGFNVLSYVLAEMPGAPLKQAILDAGIGKDVDVDFCDILRQSYLGITVSRCAPGKSEQLLQIIRDTLQKQVEQGVDRKALEAAINGNEFRSREADFGGFPKGLLYYLKAMKTWLYDDEQPYEALKYEKYYAFLREQLSTDFYEKLIQEYLLDNTHAVLVEMNPDEKLAAQQEAAVKARLEDYKLSLTADQRGELIRETEALKAYQAEPTPKEILEKIPMLSREDIDPKAAPYQNTETTIAGIRAVHHDVFANDIVYLRLLFDADEVIDYLPQLSFLTTLLGYMDTKKHSYNEFDTEVNFYTGGLASDVSLYSVHPDPEDYHGQFEVNVKVLRSQLAHALELMAEMLFETDLSDDKHLCETVAESVARLKIRLSNSGHITAASRASTYFSRTSWLSDAAVGIRYYRFLEDLENHFEERIGDLREGFAALLHAVLRQEKLLVSCTCDADGLADLNREMPAFLERLDQFVQSPPQGSLDKMTRFVPENYDGKEGFMIPGDIQYVAVAGDFSEVSDYNMGALRVVRHLLNYDYLWNEVRVKGGAYGVMCNFDRGGKGSFVSYRDPKLAETLSVYQSAAEYLAGYEAPEREVLKTIIGTISGMDVPLTPYMKGRRSMSAWLSKMPLEVVQQERDQVLSCTAQDIRQTAPVVEAITNSGHVCVVGQEQHLQEAEELFTRLETL